MAERKKYIDAEIPILNSEIRILGTPEELNNKTIKLDLTRKLRGKGLVITFRLFNKEGKLIGLPKKMELVKSYILQMIRKRSDYVEDSFKARCADVRVIVKPLLITRKRVSRAVRKNLRNTAREFLLEYLKEKNYTEICNELLDNTLQKMMFPKLKKIYPLSFCDLRVFETKDLEKINLEKAFKKKITEDMEEAEETPEETTKEEISEESIEEKVEESIEEEEEAEESIEEETTKEKE
ncbi:hypothetical protein KAI32_02730 [Candidatus Pacearchaeota archaeon]|nr:hypothetical protein [Candidatus Pacearchaeota archaeon]